MIKLVATFLGLAMLLTGCATRTASNIDSTLSAQQAAPEAGGLAQPHPALLHLNPSNYFLISGGQRVEVKQRDLRGMLDELPLNIRMRPVLASAEEKEWKAFYIAAGRDPSAPLNWDGGIAGLVQCFQASDGLEFLVDHYEMALWYRQGKGPWTCALSRMNVVKTFGGMRPHLPVCYAGAKRFLIAETLPGKMIGVGAPFPKAHCATFLIDCEQGRVIARTEATIYDHNPPLVFPKEWKDAHGIEFEQEAQSKVNSPGR